MSCLELTYPVDFGRGEREIHKADIYRAFISAAAKSVPAAVAAVGVFLCDKILSGNPQVSYKQIRKEIQVKSDQSVTKYLDQLEEARLLKIKRRYDTATKKSEINHFSLDLTGLLKGKLMSILRHRAYQKRKEMAEETNTEEAQNKKNRAGEPPQKMESNILSTTVDTNISFISNKFDRSRARSRTRAHPPKRTRTGADAQAHAHARARHDSASETSPSPQPPSPRAVAAAALADSQAKSKAKRREKDKKIIDKTPALAITKRSVEAMWREAMAEYLPGVPMTLLTPEEFGRFRDASFEIACTTGYPAFFGWVIDNWTYLRDHEFGWLRDKGRDLAFTPSIPELLRYWKRFATLYGDQERKKLISRQHRVSTRVKELGCQLETAKRTIADERAENLRLQKQVERLQFELECSQEAVRRQKQSSDPMRGKNITERLEELGPFEEAQLEDWR